VRRTSLLAGLLVCALGLAGCSVGSGDPPTTEAPSPYLVTTEAGDLLGRLDDRVLTWRGIPYAAPPVGERRWTPPQPVEPWTGVRDATSYDHACLQAPRRTAGLGGPVRDTAEDCLYLNVSRPTGPVADLPVMVWIHGGAFLYGSGSLPVYNSAALVKRGVVLVTLNYRLGRLGFFAHPALPGAVANFGLLDQVAALEWVRDNVEGFGGDPGNVTVFGESAGGSSVNALMSSPTADGLFARAITQSGLGREPTKTLDRARADGAALVDGLGVPDDTPADLRTIPAEQVMTLPAGIMQGDTPVLDAVLPRSVADTFAAGEEAQVPWLVGTTDLEVPDTFLAQFGAVGDQVRDRLLPEGPRRDAAIGAYGDAATLDQHLMSDVIFTEPARHLAALHARTAPTYRYRFAITSDLVREAIGGAPHASEIPYVFDDATGQRFSRPDSAQLADQVSDAWVGFATDGTPADWPGAEDGAFREFTTDGPRVVDADPWERRLDAVESGYARRS
jgi:para-nitrobenzyl esterase